MPGKARLEVHELRGATSGEDLERHMLGPDVAHEPLAAVLDLAVLRHSVTRESSEPILWGLLTAAASGSRRRRAT